MGLFLFLSELTFISVLISKIINSIRCNLHKQKILKTKSSRIVNIKILGWCERKTIQIKTKFKYVFNH